MTPPRVMVLGAGGFIGSHLVRRFVDGGHDVVAATRTPAATPAAATPLIAPFDDVAHFAEVTGHCDVVIHAASESTPGSTDAKPQLEGNLRTTLALIEALQRVPACRLVFLSSGGTLYGNRDAPATEQDALSPRSYHGAGKAAAEHFIQAWAMQYGGHAVILRPSNVYGPGQPARAGFGVIPAAFDAIISGIPLPIWGDGSLARDYLYIDDLVDLCVHAAGTPLPPGASVFNAGTGTAVSLDQLLQRIEAATSRVVPRSNEPARRVDVHSIATDSTAAARRFGWSPSVTLDEGLRRTWQWFLDHH